MIKDNEVYNIILNRRSIRRFKQKPILLDVLKKLVNAARLAPSAANLQPLEFYIV
ncbi:MAG: nitroreductase family protein, partial [Epsilonproteobacteria bacterium]|nr:nitroreductase family protein [Campylobacterota bacterium]